MTIVMRMFGIALIASFTSAFLSKRYKGVSDVILLGAALCIIASSMAGIIMIVDFALGLGKSLDTGNIYIKAMLRITGIALILKLLLSFIKDIGGESLMFAVELGGKVCILVIALPFIVQALDVLSELLR